MGNVHLKGAFSEAAGLFLRHAPGGKKVLAEIEKKHGKGNALSMLAHTIGRAVFDMLSRGISPSRTPCRVAEKSAGEPDVSLEPAQGRSSWRSRRTRTPVSVPSRRS